MRLLQLLLLWASLPAGAQSVPPLVKPVPQAGQKLPENWKSHPPGTLEWRWPQPRNDRVIIRTPPRQDRQCSIPLRQVLPKDPRGWSRMPQWQPPPPEPMPHVPMPAPPCRDRSTP